MSAEEIKTLVVRVAALADALEERSKQAVREVSQSSNQLRQTATGLGLDGQRLAHEAVNAIRTQTQGVVEQGLQQAAQAASNLREQGIALERLQRAWLWKSVGVLVIGAVLAAGGAGFLIWKSMEAVKLVEFSSAIVRATQAGILTQCGNALCVKAGKNAQHYVKNNEYILIEE
jgi:ABC-type multidrug transport system fused ATPase/permease subunit